MKAFEIDISDLKSGARGALPIEAEGHIEAHEFSAHVSLVGSAFGDAGVFTFEGRVKGTVFVPCARCLELVSVPYDEALEFRFALANSADDETLPLSGNVLDFADVLFGAIRADLPISILCKEGCPGLCPVCGNNLGKSLCGCEKQLINPVIKTDGLIDLFKE